MGVTEQDVAKMLEEKRAALGIDDDKKPLAFSPPPAPLSDDEDNRRQEQFEAAKRSRQRQQIIEARASLFIGRERYRDCTLDNFVCSTDEQQAVRSAIADYEAHLHERVCEGCGVVLIGPPGTGKDHLLSVLMKAAVTLGLSVKWCNGMDLFGDVRDRMDGEGRPESEFVASMTRPRVLAISDPLPPFGGLTAFQTQMLFRFIDGRYSRKFPTWLTLNVKNRGEAENRMGTQIVDRLVDDAVVLECNWPSYRRKRM